MANTPLQQQRGGAPAAGSGVGQGRQSFMHMMDGAPHPVQPFLPSDLVGGSIPYIPGTEDEGVWHAASQSCGTERVHYCYTIAEGRCWYLATPSSALANSPDSWCPLASALPGNSEYWDKETVYLYEQEGAAGALRWEADTGRMQVFLGASRTILPRIQSMEANFVTINPEVARPVPWRNRALRQEMLSRVVVKMMIVAGLGVIFLSIMAWLASFAMVSLAKPQLEKARSVTTEATNQLMINAVNAQQSNIGRHLSRIIELFNVIGSFGGVLVKYQVMDDDTVVWEALIPSAVRAEQLQATAQGVEQDGRIKIRGTN